MRTCDTHLHSIDILYIEYNFFTICSPYWALNVFKCCIRYKFVDIFSQLLSLIVCIVRLWVIYVSLWLAACTGTHLYSHINVTYLFLFICWFSVLFFLLLLAFVDFRFPFILIVSIIHRSSNVCCACVVSNWVNSASMSHVYVMLVVRIKKKRK